MQTRQASASAPPPSGPPLPSSAQELNWLVKGTALGARRLVKTDWIGHSDPYLVLSVTNGARVGQGLSEPSGCARISSVDSACSARSSSSKGKQQCIEGLKGPVAKSNSSGSCVWNWGFELTVGPEAWEVSSATNNWG